MRTRTAFIEPKLALASEGSPGLHLVPYLLRQCRRPPETSAGEEVAGVAACECPAQLGQSVALYAADPLGGQVEELAYFALGTGLAPVQAVTKRQHAALVLGQPAQEVIDLTGEKSLRHDLERGLSGVVDHQVTE